jgi:transmembrane sensor
LLRIPYMSKNENALDKHLLELMTRFHNGQATAAEIREIELWYENQASNGGYTDCMSAEERLETKQKMLLRIDQSIQEEAIPVAKIYPYKKSKAFALAAAILLAIGTTFYFGLNGQKTQKTEQVRLKDIAPGNDKAILILANGKKISLESLGTGEIASQNGIKISKTANGQLIYETIANTENTGAKPEFNTIEVPVGGQWQVVLPDHSKVWLNALSRITYPLHFTGGERNVEISGEAYFEVAHNAKMPFKVQCGKQTVEVLGTHFNIMGYADQKLIKTTLLEGSVKVSEGKNTKLLVPGEQAQVGLGEITTSRDVDMEDVVAWKNGYFKFDENLEAIMTKVARWYDVEVVYQFKPDPNIVYAGKVSRSKNISSLLKIIAFDGDVHFKIEGRRIIVTK